MCGLFGACGPGLSDKDINAVKVLGELTKIRGKDSTGLFTVSRRTEGNSQRLQYRTYRAIQESPVFLASKPVKELLDMKPFVLGGHCRFATHGSVKVSNAHPFSVGHFIGEHNGTIGGLFDRVNDKTDSLVFFENMQKHGIEKSIKDGLNMGGDMALVFINKSNSTLNYYRNGGRPLWIGIEEKKKKFYWSSQQDFLELLQRNHLVRFSTIYSVAPFMMHSVDLRNQRLTVNEIKPDIKRDASAIAYSRFNHPPSTSVPVVRQQTPTCRLSPLGYGRTMFPSKIISKSPAVLPAAAEKKSKVFFRGYRNTLMQIDQAAKLILGKYCACDCCGNRPHSLFSSVYWLSDKAWLCESCMFDEDIQTTCYEGTSFYRGCFVDENNEAKTKRRPTHDKENIIPF